MFEGVININKPAGWTSQDVCAKLRSRLKIRKIGHSGTLDPMATGVLPVCIGRAARIIEYYDSDRKTYHASMILGKETDTLDITGTVVAEHADAVKNIKEEDVKRIFSEYIGNIIQVPPRYSAIRITGKRAYELARKGADFEIRSREITVFSNEITYIDLSKGIVEFDVICSKGTYIRTICDDIGKSLGCGAVMTSLTRTGSGYFRIDDSYDPEEIAGMTDEEIACCVIPADVTLIALGTIEIDNNRVIAFKNGNTTADRCYEVTDVSKYGNFYKVYGRIRGIRAFLGIGEIDRGTLIPRKVFFIDR